jgi:hypothetical protein
MKKISVEVVGYEYSVYGGEDGHYCGTDVVPNKVIDLLDIDSKYDAHVRVTISHNDRLSLIDTRDVPYWDHSTLYVKEPGTGNLGIAVDSLQYEVAKYLMGVKEVGDRFDEYCHITSDLNYKGMTLGEFKEILRNL